MTNKRKCSFCGIPTNFLEEQIPICPECHEEHVGYDTTSLEDDLGLDLDELNWGKI